MYAAMTKGGGNAADERSSSAYQLASDDKIYHRDRITIMHRSRQFFGKSAGAIDIYLDMPEEAAALIKQQRLRSGKPVDKVINTLAHRNTGNFDLPDTAREMLQEGGDIKRDAPHRTITCRPSARSLTVASHQEISSSDRPM
jgi:hypothetical protein